MFIVLGELHELFDVSSYDKVLGAGGVCSDFTGLKNSLAAFGVRWANIHFQPETSFHVLVAKFWEDHWYLPTDANRLTAN